MLGRRASCSLALIAVTSRLSAEVALPLHQHSRPFDVEEQIKAITYDSRTIPFTSIPEADPQFTSSDIVPDDNPTNDSTQQ